MYMYYGTVPTSSHGHILYCERWVFSDGCMSCCKTGSQEIFNDKSEQACCTDITHIWEMNCFICAVQNEAPCHTDKFISG